jgi:hydrogenase nickel incorporation protein HypA/HybF
MHELALVESIFKEIETAREKMEISEKITQIELEVGELTGAVPQSLAFCFEALKGNTELQDAELRIRSVQGTFLCLRCKNTGEIELFPMICPSCDSLDMKITGGDELRILSIEIERGDGEV